MLKSKILWVQSPRPTHVTQPCNARSSRTNHGKRSRVGFRLELGVAAPARGFTHAVPPRRLPLTVANSRPKQVQKRNGAVYWTKSRLARAKQKVAGTLVTRMENSGDVKQTLCMILEGRA
jgi:hypothetical protein